MNDTINYNLADNLAATAKLNSEIKRLKNELRKVNDQRIVLENERERMLKHMDSNNNVNILYYRGDLEVFKDFNINEFCDAYENIFAMNNISTHHVEIEDNSYGLDFTKYVAIVENGFRINYHPSLFHIIVNNNTDIKLLAKLVAMRDKSKFLEVLEPFGQKNKI